MAETNIPPPMGPEKGSKEKLRLWFNSLLQSSMHSDYYGTITIKLERGVIKHVSKEQTYLPPKDL